MKKGTRSGAPCLLDNTFADMVMSTVPSIDMVRFINPGEKACMDALHLARAFMVREVVATLIMLIHIMLR